MGKYTVRLNGTEIPVREVTVSAMPFNKVWDGKQRNKDQTETDTMCRSIWTSQQK